jgi:hypothetical protein
MRTSFDSSPAIAGMAGGIGGGVAQAYATMGEPFRMSLTPAYSRRRLFDLQWLPLRILTDPGFCTCMKTVEITRHKASSAGAAPESTFKVFMDIYRREGIAGINKGVNAVALRQSTNFCPFRLAYQAQN